MSTDRAIIKGTRRRIVWQALAVIVLLGAIVLTYDWQNSYVALFLTIILTGLLAITIVRLLLVGRAGITLERDNFEIRTPLTRTSFARDKASDFRVRKLMGTSWVEFTYTGDAARIGFGEPFSSQTGDNQFKIDNHYEYKPEKIAAIMNDYCADPEGANVHEPEEIPEQPGEPRPV